MDLEQQRQSEESLQDAAEPQEQPEQQRTSPDETHGPAPHSGLPDAAQAALEPQECHTIDLIRYWWNLPQLDEMQFPEFGNILRDGRRRHASRFKVVKLVPTVDAALAKFLNLSPSQRAQGIAIKARPNSVLSLLPRWSPVRESYLHTDILPKNRFLWPALGAFVGRRYPALYLVMPRARGDVWEAFKKHPEKFDLPLAIAEIVLAVKALHEAGLVHRDIALSNFYISFSGHIALGDMETVTVEGMRETQASRLGHTAPEVEGNPFTRLGLEYIAYSKKSDMSSLGAALSKFAWDKGKQETEQLILDLAKKLQDTDPARRLDFDEIMQHPLFEGIDFDAVEQGLTPPPFKDSEYTWEGAGFF
ncbi:rhoptry kinase family protein ROP35 [Besnoitia besnoiti]|uniref:Rhoptry kinase family protein ROP35 n=1 Tax=Besnoitia besnoiti TaxID=94643 RepID=A0A2A9M894_BESBE|nr:rhoptry kinase family protein ROP35 [Besnoitia besnoiti]PFH31612.1 rhoptry kinase family protein ROP35 [Besnoitia besnoiti]